jgi:hypothetical protein
LTDRCSGDHDPVVRRCAAALALALAAGALASAPGSATRRRCDARTPAGSLVDCFSGAYHGTGFLPMEETISFRRVTTTRLRADALWRRWLADAAINRGGKPCRNGNAIAYEGSFSFYGGGSFIACSQSNPNMLSGFFQVRSTYRFVDGSTSATLTGGAFSATASLDNVLELVFSDAAHRHYAQPEVVLGQFKN